MPTVAEMIETLRVHGMTQEQIAARLDVTEQAVYSWHSGRVKKPRRATLESLESLYRSIVGGEPPHLSRPATPPAAVPGELAPDMPPADVRQPRTDLDGFSDSTPLPERHGSPPPRLPGEAFRFIHCADLHVDSPLKGIQKIDPRHAPWIQLATRRAFTRLVDMAIDDKVDFVVIAGDLFDGEWKSADTGIFVGRQLARLTTAGIRVFAVAGNHDAASEIKRSVRWPEDARLLGDTAESIVLDDLGVVIHGRSFGDRYVSSDFVQAYPASCPGLFNLGILHTSLAGDSGHATYAPCSAAQLAARGYDYWALGHVHVPRIIQTDPHIVFSGNIQGRDIGEPGPRGCFVVTVDADRRPSPHFVSLDDVRWETIEVSLQEMDADTIDDVVATVVNRLEAGLPDEDRLLACRVRLIGATPLHGRLLSRRGSLKDEVALVSGSQLDGRVCLEKVVVHTTDPDTATPSPDGVPQRAVAMLDEEFQRLGETGSDALLADVADLRRLFDTLSVLDSMNPGRRDSLQASNNWTAVINEARALLAAELGSTAGDAEDGR
jgi:DNA repair exonuclease SbcCD nuclease subunit/transcriptional regulator with XRE-family HTH domain